jgi:magnesium transporter
MRICEQYNHSTGAVAPVECAITPKFLQQPDTLLWVDVTDPTDEDIEWLRVTFGFHHLALEDVRSLEQRAKVDPYEGYNFCVLRTATCAPDLPEITTQQLGAFVGERYLVTVHYGDLAPLDDIHTRWARAHAPGVDALFLFYLVADAIVDAYFPLLDDLGERIDDIDATLFDHPGKATLQGIFAMRRALLALRKVLGPMRDAFNELMRISESGESPAAARTRIYFADVYDHVLRLTDFVDTYRDMLATSVDAYQSSLGNRLNTNMQRLTVAATILATATVVTGFFGMNLRGAGVNVDYPHGGEIVLGALLLVTALEVWLFRRAGWM